MPIRYRGVLSAHPSPRPASGTYNLYVLSTDGGLYFQDNTTEIHLITYISAHASTHKGGGSDEIDAVTTSVNGLMSAADKVKLDTLAAGDILISVRNETGSTLLKGRAVVITGYSVSESLPLVEYADKDDPDLRPANGVLSEDINNNNNGDAFIVGTLKNVDTSSFSLTDQLVLGNNGNLVRPPPDNDPFTGEIQNLGSTSRIHATEGEIIIAIDGQLPVTANELFTLIGLSNVTVGFYDTNQYTLAFTDGTRTLTLTPVSSYYKWYEMGVPYRDNADSIVITDVEGKHYIYYDDGTLSELVNPTNAQILNMIRTKAFVSLIYWDATNSKALYVGYEGHSYKLDKETHIALHTSLGAQYRAGNDATNVLADENGSLDTHAQFGLMSGEMADEDVVTASNAVGSTTGLPIYYLSGSESSPVVRQQINSGFSVFTTGTGRLAYNLLSGGTWSIAEAANNSFVLCHVFAVNDYLSSRRLIAFLGQENYNTITAARAGAEDEITGLRVGGLVSPELVKLYTFIFQTSDSYSNSVQARIRSTDTDGDYVDWRTYRGGGSSGVAITPVFSDADLRIFSDADPTKLGKFDLSGLTTSTTRTVTLPDKDITLDDDGDSRPPTSHASSHENGGGDEISVAGLSGSLADAQTPTSHASTHENGGSDEISVAGLSGALADAQTPTAHASSHTSGTDDIQNATSSVKGLLTNTDWSTFNSKMPNPFTTDGDLLIRSSGSPARLGIGTAGQVLTVVSGLPAWQTPSSDPSLVNIFFTAKSNEPPSSNPATLSNEYDRVALRFDDSTDEHARFTGVLYGYKTNGLTVTIGWRSVSTSGNVRWTVGFERLNDGVSLASDSYDTVQVVVDAAKGTANQMNYATIAFTNSQIDGLQDGEFFRIIVSRDANDASDTMSGDARLYFVHIKETA